jgi:protein HOOK3
VNLVNKDQVEILASLRESVNEDKASLEAETDRLKKQIKELGEKNRMQLEQVNALLLEKVYLQSEGIGQREKMLQRERDIGFVVCFLLLCVPLRMHVQGLACMLIREGYS